MKYFLDTEFDGFGGRLLSLALVDQHGDALYITYSGAPVKNEWVRENVMPIMTPAYSDLPPDRSYIMVPNASHEEAALSIAHFFARRGGSVPYIITDWPDDIRYLCQAVITGPGNMADIPRMQFDMVRVDAYPTTLKGAVQHNALWDALALKAKLFP